MRLFESENRHWTSPYIYLMAVLVVAIKVLYGLDGLPRNTPLGLPDAPPWTQWAQSALDGLQGPYFPSAPEQVVAALLPSCRLFGLKGPARYAWSPISCL